MICLKQKLFLFFSFLFICFNNSSEDISDLFNSNNDNNTDNAVNSDDRSVRVSSQSVSDQFFGDISSEISVISSVSSSSPEISSSPSSTSTTSTSTPSTTTIVSSTSSQTSPSTKPSTKTSTKPTTTTVSSTSSESIPSSSVTTIDFSTNTSPKEQTQCLQIELMAKIIFKYNSTEGIDQQFELSAGNIQSNKCQQRQTLVIKYDLVERTQIILGITIDDIYITIDSIRFEYPLQRLPEDYNKDIHSEETETCSAKENTNTRTDDVKCLIKDIQHLKGFKSKYRINQQIYCKELPLILLKDSNQTSIGIHLTDFKLIVTNELNQTTDFGTKDNNNSNGFCPLESSGNQIDGMFANSTKMWIGISYAFVGALVMFGFVFIYEKFVRERLLYNPVPNRQEPDI